jgi:hypothetical protein
MRNVGVAMGADEGVLSYAGRPFETGESRKASGGKVPFWRCVPSNQTHSTISFPSAVAPTTVTVIRGLPDFSCTVSPILNAILAPRIPSSLDWRHGR